MTAVIAVRRAPAKRIDGHHLVNQVSAKESLVLEPSDHTRWYAIRRTKPEVPSA